MAIWPAIIKFSEEDELTYISDLAEWNGDEDLHFFEYDPLDVFIDSSGLIHHLNNRDNDFIVPEPTGEIIDLRHAIGIVQAHFSSVGSCCAAKLSARSVSELIEILGMDKDGL